MDDITQPRTARITITVPQSVKDRIGDAAAARRWTLTTLIEVAIEAYLDADAQKSDRFENFR